MEILVCIKQVPDDSVEIAVNPSTGLPALEDVTKVVNAFDTYALEMAVRLKEAKGGEVTVLSVGGEDVKNSLKNCLAVGADKAYLASCDKADELDAAGIAKVLAKAKADIEAAEGKKFDFVFFGKEATDTAASQAGEMFADELALPVVTNVIEVSEEGGKASIKRETEDGYVLFEAALPAVVTVQKPNYDPRYPTIKSKMVARKKPIEALTVAELPASGLKVVKVYAPAKRAAGVKIKAENAEEAVAQAMDVMKAAKVF